MEATVKDLRKGLFAKNNVARHLLIDFHGVVERWVKALAGDRKQHESLTEILNDILAGKSLLTPTSEVGMRTEEGRPSGALAPKSRDTGADHPQGTWIPQGTVSALDGEIGYIWSQLASLEDLLKRRGLSQEEADILTQLQGSLRLTKEKILHLGGLSSPSELVDVILVEWEKTLLAIPLVDIDAILDLKDLGNIAGLPKQTENPSLRVITHQDKGYPVRALDGSLRLRTPSPADLEIHKVAVLAQSGGELAALMVDRVLERKTILVDPARQSAGSTSALKGTATLGPDRSCAVLNIKNLVS